MKREILSFSVPRTKRRTDFLFNDGEFRPRSEKNQKQYKRQNKHRKNLLDYTDRFYL
jgi:hypothetical protein